MDVVCLEYHDIVTDGDTASSGFRTAGADSYKLDMSLFAEHLSIYARCGIEFSVPTNGDLASGSRVLTFDDGGVGAVLCAQPVLDKYDIPGCFLIATGKIGHQRFLSAEQIRALRLAGHCVGTHTESHPLLMATLSHRKIDQEWRTSTDKLAQITGEATQVGSISGGQYSTKIAELADKNGIRVLFTSEPTTRCVRVGDCLVVGRYTVKSFHDAEYARAILNGDWMPRAGQWLHWNSKKLLKKALGTAYTSIRERILRQPGR